MSPPLLGVEGQGQCNVSMMASSSPADCISQSGSGLKERNYFGLSDCSSVDSSVVSSTQEESKKNLNLKATELRLGLPGSQSPGRDSDFSLLSSVVKFDEKQLFPLVPSNDVISCLPQKTMATGSKRGFDDTVDAFMESKSTMFTEGNWMFNAVGSDPGQSKLAGNVMSNRPSATQSAIKCEAPVNTLQESTNKIIGSNNTNAPAAKAQVVGWPPIRSFRKNSLVPTSKNNDEVDGKPGPGALFVKVSVDGAPYLRKVDLRMYSAYQELSSALEKMFSCFIVGQCGPEGAPTREMLSESKLRGFLHGSEYVLTYGDKDGDWMLIGDVPWEMFIASCKRLKIMKGSAAVHLFRTLRFELIRHDVVEPILLEVDQIYHSACPASPVHYKYNPVKTIKTNVMGTLNMLGLARRINARFFLTSTSEVYGGLEFVKKTADPETDKVALLASTKIRVLGTRLSKGESIVMTRTEDGRALGAPGERREIE